MVICEFVPYGLTDEPKTHPVGSRLCRTHTLETTGQIPSIQSFIVICPFAPVWACPWANTLSNQERLESRILEHIYTGWINTIRNSKKLFKSVVVQYDGLITLALDFQGEMLKKLFHRNRMAD